MVKDKKTKEVVEQEVDNSAVNQTVDPKTDDVNNKSVPLEKAPTGQMFVKVYSPFKHYYEGLAVSISGANDTGPFDILAGHHRFLTLLSTCELDVKTIDGTEVEKIKIDRGIMYVKEDRVTVFLDV